MITVESIAEKLLDTYPWGYEVKDGKYTVWNYGKGDIWHYDSPEELISDWYEIMLLTYTDHGFWTEEEMELAKKLCEV